MTTAIQNFGWLISEFVRTADGVTDAVAVSTDGLLMAASDNLGRDRADHLAAIVSGITSLAQNASTTHGFRGMKLVMIEMLGGFLMVGRIRDGSCLGVLAAEGVTSAWSAMRWLPSPTAPENCSPHSWYATSTPLHWSRDSCGALRPPVSRGPLHPRQIPAACARTRGAGRGRRG